MAEAAVDTAHFTTRTRKGDPARAALLDAARRIASREGVEAIRLSAVADEANIAHATAYGYFRSRKELLQSVVAEDLNALSRAMRAVAGLPEPPDAPPPPSQIVRYELKTQGDGYRPFGVQGTESTDLNTSADAARRAKESERMLPAQGGTEDKRPPSEYDEALGGSLDRRIAYIERKLSSVEENARHAAEVLSRDVESLCNSFAALVRIDNAGEDKHESEAAEASNSADNASPDSGILQLELADIIPDEPKMAEAITVHTADAEKSLHEATSDTGEAQMTESTTSVQASETIALAPQTPDASRAAPPDYLTVARRAAMSAVASQIAHSEKAKTEQKRRETRWMIAAAAVAGVLLVGAAIMFREFAARPAQVAGEEKPASAGITYSSAHAKATAARALTPLDRTTAEARAGKPDAELAVGLKYLSGDGIPKDEHEAATWIARAAEAGDPTAQSWLGTLYQRGKGVTADPIVAFSWFEKAAEAGNRRAMHNLAIAYAQGSGVELNYFEAARWFARAADLGYVDSAFNLAVLYERGDGVPQSLIDAYKWYAIAAAAGDTESRTRMSAIANELSADDLAAAERAAAAFKPPRTGDANPVPKT